MACHADPADIARPSVQTLAEDTGLHERNVQKHLRELEACGRLQLVLPSGPARA